MVSLESCLSKYLNADLLTLLRTTLFTSAVSGT